MTRKATAIRSMAADRTNRETGEVIPCRLDTASRTDLDGVADALIRRASGLESLMLRELRKIPIWEHFVSKTFGLVSGGPIAAYLVASIDIHKAVKPSNLIRYCGYAVIGGHIERPTKGDKLHYNATMRMRLHQWADVLVKNGGPAGEKSRYAKIYHDSHDGDLTSELYDKKTNTWTSPEYDAKAKAWTGNSVARKGGKHAVSGKAKRKAITRMLEDLYIVWRAIEGLPAWPTYYEQTMKHAHGGVPLKDLQPVVRVTCLTGIWTAS